MKKYTHLFLAVFTVFFFNCSKKEKEPEPAPDPALSYSTVEYLRSKANKQVITFDANTALTLTTDNGLKIEIPANSLTIGQSAELIKGEVQLEIFDVATNKDLILNCIGTTSPYRNIFNGITRLQRAFKFSFKQPSVHGSKDLRNDYINLKVPATDQSITAANNAELLDYVNADVPNNVPNWLNTGLKTVFGSYSPPLVQENNSVSFFYQLNNLNVYRVGKWLGIGDHMPLTPPGPGSVSKGIAGTWASPSSAEPVIYVAFENHTCTALRLSVNPVGFVSPDKCMIPCNTSVTISGIQYEKGKLYYGEIKGVDCTYYGPLKLDFKEINETDLMSKLETL